MKYFLFIPIIFGNGLCVVNKPLLVSEIIQTKNAYSQNTEMNQSLDYLKYLEHLEHLEHFEICQHFGNSYNLDDENTLEFYGTKLLLTEHSKTIFMEVICSAILILLNNRLRLLRSIDTSIEKNVINNHKIYKDTMNFYIPMAHIIGLDTYVEELGNMSLLTLFPKQFSEFKLHISNSNLAKKLIERINMLQGTFIHHEIKGRIKSIYSAWDKNKNVNEINDLMAIRIIVNYDSYKSESIKECYNILYTILNKFYTINTKDYIKNPKSNGYESLHTTILDNDFCFEIQIRTTKMDKIANFGRACNYKYKKKY